ncbi:MAG: hypothetical protein A2X20_00090 [Bacteroidetes bacterium GWE2_40_15]|nr:MAG: hypothetical protein A2X20_00090 [Bacteroidetes bacterium GWE2_40_15]
MRNLIYTIIFISLCSCQSNDDTSSIELERNDEVSIFDLADSISILKLETNNESLIKGISKVIPYKNRFYIFDSRSQVIFCFDSTGNYLFKINRLGRGPEEYERVEDFNINSFNDQLILLVPWGFILTFDLDGNFISKTKLPEEVKSYNNVYAINKDTLLFLSSNEYRAVYYSSKNKIIIDKCLGEDEMPEIGLTTGSVYTYDDSLYFSSVGLNNNVLNMSDPNRRIVYNWDFGSNNLTKARIRKALKYKLKMIQKREVFDLTDIFEDNRYPTFYRCGSHETDRFAITSVLYKVRFGILCIFKDKISGKVDVFRETKEGIQFSYFSAYNNYLILYQSYKNKFYSEETLSPKQLEILKSHNPETDNPFLVIYHLK